MTFVDLSGVTPEKLEPGDYIRHGSSWMRIVKISSKDDWYTLVGELDERFTVYAHSGVIFEVRRRM